MCVLSLKGLDRRLSSARPCRQPQTAPRPTHQYVPWNWHEPSKGTFDFESEGRNITRFVEIAQEVGLLVLMRAGPFMCGGWEFGGLPWYLINETQVYRTYDDVYISFVDRWWGELAHQ